MKTQVPDTGKRSFSEDIISVFSSNVFSLVANLLTVVLVSRVLGPELYGLYTAVLVIPLLVVSFFQMGIRPSTVFMIGSGKHDANKVVSAVVSTLLITGSAGMLFSGIAYVVMYKTGFTPLLIGLALATIPMRLTAIYAGGVFLAKEQMKRANLMNWLTALLTLLFALIFVWLLKLGVAGALLGLMTSNLVVSAYALNMLRRNYTIKLSLYNPIIRQMLQLGVVYALSFLIIQLNYRADILLLQWLADTREVGLYSLGVAVSELLWQIPLAVSLVVMTRSANTTDQKLMNESTARLLRLSLISGITLSVFIYLLSPFVIPLVFGTGYIGSVRIIQTVLPGIIIVIIFRVLSGQLSGMGKPQVALRAFILALILNVILNYLLIPRLGGMGAAIATNISYLIGTIIYIIAYCKITGTRVNDLFHFSKNDFTTASAFIKKRLHPKD